VPDLLGLSARIIDSGVANEPVNRITQELSEVGDGVAVVESFSHSVAFRTDDGLVVFDASGVLTGARVVEALRHWRDDPIRALVYTHGHVDHVGGSGAFAASAASRGDPPFTVLAHEAVSTRFERYRLTDGWNRVINNRQFGWIRNADLRIGAGDDADVFGGRFLPADVELPDVTYSSRHAFSVGGLDIELHHSRGETDDHTWAWIPAHRAICCGDFLIWMFPNAGNPQKVQRYPLEWAGALRAMAAQSPALLLPAHGLPIAGVDRIQSVLLDVAGVLEDLVEQVIRMMNAGAALDDILGAVRLPAEVLARPYMRPLYDEPEFVIRNIWRMYGGWWDGNYARLKPPADRLLASEVAGLAGGMERLALRARELASAGSLELACQLAEWAVQAEPSSVEAHRVRAEVYQLRHQNESSLMAKGIFAGAAHESRRVVEQAPAGPTEEPT
jgi:alkyl sulfatase BDS1-like metallo-beta-lactamase superfamily hydrolase